MSRQRSLETLTDILCIVVSPILVMIMVGSLAFFGIQCFYEGQFWGRLNFATGLFVMAAVLVARIAVEEGREYASAFSLPLGVVTVMSVVQYCGMNPILATAFVLAIWWCTDKLTWDCTVLDEQKDASGEGLLQTTGLHTAEHAGNEGPKVVEDMVDLEATTDAEKTELTSLWQKWLQRRRRHHTPGVWVVYFGVAAIPLFGLGQALLPEHGRGAGFLLLCIYVACGLSLLMITSFLQMRRYLIQRRLPFSDKMAATWLGTGGALIVGLMILSLLLPRPNTGYSMVQTLSDQIKAASRGNEQNDDDDREASRYAVGKEGVEDKDKDGSGENQDANPESDSEQGRKAKQDAQRGKREGEEGQGGTKKSDQGKSGDDQSDSENQQSDDQRNNGQRDSRAQGRNEKEDENANAQERQQENNKGENNDEQNETITEERSQPSAQSNTNPLQNLLQNFELPPLPKILYYILIAIVVLVGLYFYGRPVFKGIGAFFADLAEFFRRLFGGRKRDDEVVEEAESEVVAPRPFRAYRDPFATGLAKKMSTQQLVAYSFEALQAWAYEQQCARLDEQTPLEFAGQIAANNSTVGTHAKTLALLYNQVAYAPGTLGSQAVDHVRSLWQAIRTS